MAVKIRRFLNNTRKRVAIEYGRPKAVIEPTLNGYNVLFLFDLTELQFGSASEAREAAIKAPTTWPVKPEAEKQPTEQLQEEPTPPVITANEEHPKDELASLWYVNVVDIKTGKLVQSVQASNKQEAEWLEKGMDVNLDHDTQKIVINGPQGN